MPPTNIQILNHLSGSRIEVKENVEIEIACKVSNAKPKARITWYRNNVAFNPGLGKLKSRVLTCLNPLNLSWVES